MEFRKELLSLGFACVLLNSICHMCELGHKKQHGKCVDVNECENPTVVCGDDSKCINSIGSFICQCNDGFENSKGFTNFTLQDDQGQCIDINNCKRYENICGHMSKCENLIGSYKCTCQFGYINKSNVSGNGIPTVCEDINECKEAEINKENLCGDKGTCENINGSYWCQCPIGYTNYGNERTPCSKLSCDGFTVNKPSALGGLADILFMMRNSCLALSNPAVAGGGKADGVALLEKLLTATESILSPGPMVSSEDVSGLLGTVENSILLIGPQLKANSTKMGTTETDAQIAVQRGKTRPAGPLHLTNENVSLNTDWTTAAGAGPYPGFALAALVSYKNLEGSMNRSFEEIEKEEETEGVSFQVFSKVVSVVVSNPSTQNLSSPVNIIFRHLQDIKEPFEVNYMCAYWKETGAWSTDGCSQQHSNATHTVCTCNHLSSFAVLLALYPVEPNYALELVTKIGLSISVVCLVLSILTFKFCRPIQGTRTTIHLHLCICLFMADLVFLVGISQTKPEGGCRFVAGMLHYFFLGVMTWMLLEGVQLYRMVVLVFNATIRPLYLYLFGYGIPLCIVVLSAIIRPKGYGTKQYCWLSLKDGLIWSFFGPVCIIIILNVFFFIVTVWRLAQKFATLNPDLSKLHKIRAFTVTAIAQMCILGLMWVFGAFLFDKHMTAVEYIFTILNSLQGVLIFVMHCLLSKQVRDEYVQFLSCICTPQKKRYSDFSSTNPSSSQSQGSRSGQHTGESQI